MLRYSEEVQNRNEEIYTLTAKIRVMESKEKNRKVEFGNTQEQLSMVTEQPSHAMLQLHELQVCFCMRNG